MPLFAGSSLFVAGHACTSRKSGAGGSVVALSPDQPGLALKFGTLFYHVYEQLSSYIDTKWYVGNEGAALINWRPGRSVNARPRMVSLRRSIARANPEPVHVGGAFGGEAIGYVAFAAGPAIHFVDRVALSDPLLARLPAERPTSIEKWKSGHFRRAIPAGYVEEVGRRQQLIADPGIHQYYEYVRTITWDQSLTADDFRLSGR
ncbi:MAG: hypothetical protein R2932_04065 [Caldilineaceae bacterium]